MTKKIFVSLRKNHEIMDKVVERLKNLDAVKIHLHRPFRDIINLTETIETLKQMDYAIIKASNKISMDLLYFAKEYNIPTLHDFDTVVTCRSKITLDTRLREIFKKHKKELEGFILPIPESWVGLINKKNLDHFKDWAEPHLPLVIKSHDQHDKNIRFSYLVRTLDEIDDFYRRFKNVLDYAVYIQKKIECDDLDRKIYVVGDKVFGVQRESPIQIALRENVDKVDVDFIKKEKIEITDRIEQVARILSKELNIKLFGFDLIKATDQEGYYLIDVNDFPGYRGIENIDKIIVDYFQKLMTV